MKPKLKLALLAVSSGAVALNTWGCLFRWLGDFVSDTIVMRGIA
jgi:hypothetical protein